MVRFIRSCLSGFCFVLFGIGGFVIGTLIFPIVYLFMGKKRRVVSVNIIHTVWKFFVWIMSGTGLISVKISEFDKEKILQSRGRVIVANHPSLIDVVILVSIIPNAVCVVKERLLRNIWMSFIVRMVYITNNGDVANFLDEAGRLLETGFNIIIFPEGTRTKQGDKEHKLYRGFAQLALHSGADILPIRISCDTPVLGKGQMWWNVGSKTIEFRLFVMDLICIKNFENCGNFHGNARKITEFVRQVLFFAKY